TSAITPDEPVLSTEEPDNSLSIGDEHLDTIPATKSDEFIKSSVETLIPIPSESEGIPEHVCDVPFPDNSTPLDVSKDQIEDSSESNEEFSSIDDDSFSLDNIDYVEASPPDSELVSSKVMEIVIPEVGGIKASNDNPIPFHDPIISRNPPNLTPSGESDFFSEVDAFLAVEDEFTSSQFPKSYLDPEGDMLLFEAFLNDDHSSDFQTKSSSTFLNSLLEETNNFHNSLPEFTTFSKVIFDAECESDSSDDQSSSNEDILEKIISKPLCEEEIIPMESLRTYDSSFPISSKIDSLLDEFAGELTLLKSIPSGIDETDCDFEEDIRLIEKLLYDNSSPRLPKEFISANSDAKIKSFSPSPILVKDSDSLMEEIVLFCTPDYPMPPGIVDKDYDSERDILIRKDLPRNNTLSFAKKESFHFDIPLFSRPPAKPPDGDTGILNIKMMGDISDHKAFMHKLMITLASHQEKSPNLLSHRCGTAYLSTHPSKCLTSFCYDDDDKDYTSAITPDEPVLSTKEPDNSLSMGDEHLDTIPTTESDEFIKSSVEDLILIPSESEGIPDHRCDVPSHENSPPLDVLKDHFEDFSESNEEFSSTDDDSFSFDKIDYVEASPLDSELVGSEVMKIVISKVGGIEASNDNPITFYDPIISGSPLNLTPSGESDFFREAFLNDDHSSNFKTKSPSTSLNSLLEETNNFDNSLPEFTTFSKVLFDAEYESNSSDDQSCSDEDVLDKIVSKPLCEEEMIPIKIDHDSLVEEIDLFCTPDYPMPPGIEDEDYDSERDILIRKDLPRNNTLSFAVKESFHFDIPLFSRPPAKPPDGDTGILNIKMMGDIYDQKSFMHKLMITLTSHQEKSPDLLSHRGLKAFSPFAKCPMMIHGQNNPTWMFFCSIFIPLYQP
nr:hypothetical protein [Tanacetum cinerariifolium]